MNKENLISILDSDFINVAAVAVAMYGDNEPSTAKVRLHNKIKEKKAGTGIQRLSDDDLQRAKKVLKDLADDIYLKIKD